MSHLPVPHDETPYVVTECADCLAFTALVVFPGTGVYVCAACGGTGSYVAGGFFNTPHPEPDEEAREAFRLLHKERHSIREFTRYARV